MPLTCVCSTPRHVVGCLLPVLRPSKRATRHSLSPARSTAILHQHLLFVVTSVCMWWCHAGAGVWGIRVTSPTAASPQPFVGIVDCGASFSAVNWAAARLLGLLDSNGDLKGPRGPDVISLGGRQQALHTCTPAVCQWVAVNTPLSVQTPSVGGDAVVAVVLLTTLRSWGVGTRLWPCTAVSL
jgi:hypothetical protein